MKTVNRPLSDIIIPARNEENTIQNVLHVVGFHRYVRRVFVAIDADTIDGTEMVARSFVGRGMRVSVMQTTAKGKGQVIKTALKAVQTDRVIFLDADIKNLHPEHIDILTEPNLADLIILVPAVPNNLSEFTEDQVKRMLWAWPYVSGERSLWTKDVKELDLHGYLMETQINDMAAAKKWSTWYQPTQIESPVLFTPQRLIEMERDRKWGHEQGILG